MVADPPKTLSAATTDSIIPGKLGRLAASISKCLITFSGSAICWPPVKPASGHPPHYQQRCTGPLRPVHGKPLRRSCPSPWATAQCQPPHTGTRDGHRRAIRTRPPAAARIAPARSRLPALGAHALGPLGRRSPEVARHGGQRRSSSHAASCGGQGAARCGLGHARSLPPGRREGEHGAAA